MRNGGHQIKNRIQEKEQCKMKAKGKGKNIEK